MLLQGVVEGDDAGGERVPVGELLAFAGLPQVGVESPPVGVPVGGAVAVVDPLVEEPVDGGRVCRCFDAGNKDLR